MKYILAHLNTQLLGLTQASQTSGPLLCFARPGAVLKFHTMCAPTSHFQYIYVANASHVAKCIRVILLQLN
jgi:hypothetical protein